MTKQHFIALADMVRTYNETRAIQQPKDFPPFNYDQIYMLADFCAQQNSRFDRERWLNYVNGTHGPNGGKR